MNLRFLGDALDFWKGSLLGRLREANLLQNFAVDPMTTDEAWQSKDYELLSQLLKINRKQILNHRFLLSIDREAYFGEIEHQGDLFLDPDTGIATGRVSVPSQYLLPRELDVLLGAQPKRIIAVYQHIRAQKTNHRLQRVVSKLKEINRPFSCCSYESGTVSMLFFSGDRSRVDRISAHLKNLLGARWPRRLDRWDHLQQAERDASKFNHDPDQDDMAETRAMLLAIAADAEATAPLMPSDMAENHDYYAHGKPLP